MSSTTFSDPFKQPKYVSPERKAELAKKRREAREKRLGRPTGQHGGYREGAGRKRVGVYNVTIKLTRIQYLVLMEEGKGNLHFAIQSALDKHY
jgi:hypothetical protein